MNDIIQAIVLGIVQGLSEFLPVSSSGHLELFKYMFGDDSLAEESLAMSVVLHGATALSTMIVFRKDILEIILGIFSKEWNIEKKFSLAVIISMIPAAIVGVLCEDQLSALFDKKIVFVGCMLLVTGLLLFLADKAKDTQKKVEYPSAFMIGISQAIALLPGISRSGATISTAVLLGIDKEKAARFSFLMVIPLILGKIAKDLMDGSISVTGSQSVELGAGFLAAFITGILACTWMIKIVKNSKLRYFAYYCFLVGTFAVIWGMIN